MIVTMSGFRFSTSRFSRPIASGATSPLTPALTTSTFEPSRSVNSRRTISRNVSASVIPARPTPLVTESPKATIRNGPLIRTLLLLESDFGGITPSRYSHSKFMLRTKVLM